MLADVATRVRGVPLPPDNAAGMLRLTAIGDISPRLEQALASAE